MLVNPASLAAAFVGYNLAFLEGRENTVTQHEEFAEVVTDQAGELHFPISEQLPAFRNWPKGKERVWLNLAAHNQILRPGERELSVKVPKDAFTKDRYGVFRKDFRNAGAKSRTVWDDLMWEAVLAGKTTVIYDGQPYFDTDHPIRPSDPSSAVQSNLKTSRPLSEDNLILSLQDFLAWKTPDGKELNEEPNELLVGGANLWKARRIITAGTLPNGADNILKDRLKIRLVPGLGTSWILALNAPGRRPTVVWKITENPVRPLDLGPDSPHVVEHREYRYAGETEGAAMLTTPDLMQLNEA